MAHGPAAAGSTPSRRCADRPGRTLAWGAQPGPRGQGSGVSQAADSGPGDLSSGCRSKGLPDRLRRSALSTFEHADHGRAEFGDAGSVRIQNSPDPGVLDRGRAGELVGGERQHQHRHTAGQRLGDAVVAAVGDGQRSALAAARPAAGTREPASCSAGHRRTAGSAEPMANATRTGSGRSASTTLASTSARTDRKLPKLT